MSPDSARRIVLKLGTKVVVDRQGGLHRGRIEAILNDLFSALNSNHEVLLVSSGAVELGRIALQLPRENLTLTQRQACAAVGQAQLIDFYEGLLKQWRRRTAQILVTSEDLSRRTSYLHIREAVETLLQWSVVPVINENDTTSTAELIETATQKSFGDNDRLSALIAAKVNADLLILLTDVEGVCKDRTQAYSPGAVIRNIESLTDLNQVVTEGKSDVGRGGMATKIDAARIASVSGVWTVIASGVREGILRELFESRDWTQDAKRPGTLIAPVGRLSHRQRWIGYSGSQGILLINLGAKQALVEQQSSLLPSGVVNVSGRFAAGQVVSLQDEDGVEVGRGIVNFSDEEVKQILGLQSQEIRQILGQGRADVVVQRDNLVIFQEHEK